MNPCQQNNRVYTRLFSIFEQHHLMKSVILENHRMSEEMKPKLFVATKAFIIHNGKILILRESSQYQDGSNKGKYDVPGGRVKPGERFDEGLVREISEETGLRVQIGKPFFIGEWRPMIKSELWQIVGIFFECHVQSDTVILSEDHDDFLWVDPHTINEINIIPNLLPAFEAWIQAQQETILEQTN